MKSLQDYQGQWDTPVFEPISFGQKLAILEYTYNADEFQQLANVLGSRFKPSVSLSFEDVMQQYPFFQRLLVKDPMLDGAIDYFLPLLQPFTQSPFPLSNGQVIQGPWLGQYKLGLFPSAGVNEETVKNKRVLDIGCNAGFDSFYLSSLGAREVIGIEPSPFVFQAIFLWSQYFVPNLKFFKSGWQELNPKFMGQFDLVNCQGILYHEPSPQLLLEKIIDMLVPGGKVVLETHVTLQDDNYAYFVPDMFWGDENWWWITSVDVTKAMLKAAGFVDVQMATSNSVPSQNPGHPHLTQEGHPVGGRASFTAYRPEGGLRLKSR